MEADSMKHRRNNLYPFEMEFNLISICTVLSIKERKTLCSVQRVPQIIFRSNFSLLSIKKKNRSRFFSFEKFHFHPRCSQIVTVIVDLNDNERTLKISIVNFCIETCRSLRVLLYIQHGIDDINKHVSLVLTFNFTSSQVQVTFECE